MSRHSIGKRQFVSLLRARGYAFNEQLKHTECWRNAKTGHRLYIRRAETLDEDFVRHALRQAGLKQEEIEAFIRDSRA